MSLCYIPEKDPIKLLKICFDFNWLSIATLSLLVCILVSLPNQSELTRTIRWNRPLSTLITWHWRHRNHATTIPSVIAAKQTVTTFDSKHCYKWGLGVFNTLLKKIHISFIYSLRVIRITDFNRTEHTCYSTNIPYASSG